MGEKDALPKCRISSFHRAALQRVIEKAPEVPIGALYNRGIRPADPNDASKGSLKEKTPADFASWFGDHKVRGDSVNMVSEMLTAKDVAEARRCGKQVMVWYPCFKISNLKS